jgi:flagellar biosynthesis component FlhA
MTTTKINLTANELVEQMNKAYSVLKDAEIADEVLIVHPKYKEQLKDFVNVDGIKVPVLYANYIEEDKAVFITDKELAKNVREMYESNT